MILVTASALLLTLGVASTAVEEAPQKKGVVIYQQQINNGRTFDRQDVVVEPLNEQRFRNIVRQAYDYSCGSAALTTVLQYYLGRQLSERQVMEGLLHYGESDRIVERRAFSMLDFKRLVTALGYPAGGFKATIEDLKELDHPAIVPIHHAGYKHFVVIRAIRDGRVYIADPSVGNISFTLEVFQEKWDQNVLFVVFPGGTKPIDALEVREEDLRFIDDDQVNWLAFQQFPQFDEPIEHRIQNELERQKNNPDGTVNNTSKHLFYNRQ